MDIPKRHIIVFVLLCSVASVALAQKAADSEAKKREKLTYNGWSAHVDLASPIMGLIADKGVLTGEGGFDLNLSNRFFPILELGYASVNSQAINGSNYAATAPFMRLGMNFNLLKTKDKEGKPKPHRNYAYIGLRYGMSVVNYELANVPITRDYWNESQLLSWSGKNAYAGWSELTAGVRVDMAKGFTMGWSVRLKLFLHSSLDEKQTLWYVPGYGNSAGNSFTLNYILGYTYYTKKERAKFKN
ncbi:MAG TPA: DUF6048 family protein [Paludibacteraceae bacterium]|nr:DUF6048 family protein [Paludibacteraceae bacterium]HQB69632.1 DUF6048 family protein [Paludibacteraceae bacterium]